MSAPGTAEGPGLVVVRAGARTTVQDLGRPGSAHLGVPRSGALDADALALANRLVGNPADAAGLETTVTGCALRPVGRWATVAVTGAPAEVTVGGRPAPWGLPVAVPPGAVLSVGPATAGVRSCVAVRGGIAVRASLGSRSTDTLSRLGPAPLADGDLVPVGRGDGVPAGVDVALWSPAPDVLRVPCAPGPRADWLADDGRAALTGTTWQVSSSSNRVGLRLEGPPLQRSRTDELPSEGIVLGSVQLPADGVPLVFLADHPTTGGYPVVAVVAPAGLGLLAQARPGARLRFSNGPAAGTHPIPRRTP